MKTLTLPKRQEAALVRFKRKWFEHMTENQLNEMINRLGDYVENIAQVQLLVTLKGGRTLIIEVPAP